jgi:HD-GYP domain-containing protein (c-di-GMP phosphodiesterase class II)
LLALLAGAVTALVATAAFEYAERRRIARDNRRLDAAVRARTQELEDTQLEVVERLARAAELRDDETGEHIDRMARMCELVALELGWDGARAELLRQAAILHDVGKIGLPDGILLKPGRLTPQEREEMTRHTSEGAALLAGSTSRLLQLAEVIARTHHERWDGTGYPAGIAGEDIPVEGRIAAVCDVFDALTNERPYKHAWPVQDALAEIADQRGRHFDPAVADALVTVVRRRHAEDPGWRADVSHPKRRPQTARLELEHPGLDGERARRDVPVGERPAR